MGVVGRQASLVGLIKLTSTVFDTVVGTGNDCSLSLTLRPPRLAFVGERHTLPLSL